MFEAKEDLGNQAALFNFLSENTDMVLSVKTNQMEKDAIKINKKRFTKKCVCVCICVCVCLCMYVCMYLEIYIPIWLTKTVI